MSSMRSAAMEQEAKERAALERYEEQKRQRVETEAARAAKRDAEQAQKMKRVKERQAAAQSQSQGEEEANFLPSNILEALGKTGSPARPHPQPSPLEREKQQKKAKLERKLSQLWEDTGLKVQVASAQVTVPLPESMLEFLAEVNAATERAPIVEKKRRGRSSGIKN